MGSKKSLPRDVEEQNKMVDASLPVIGFFGFWKKKCVLAGFCAEEAILAGY